MPALCLVQQTECAGKSQFAPYGFRAGGAFVKDSSGFQLSGENHDTDLARTVHAGEPRQRLRAQASRAW